ncbi:helix-turn-helix domain-containing protein [Mesorhizobium loti]|uniref:Helix-turn-helix domain-containing protein n=1 Tax=Mesorhizobium loti R88b TaxID=935548 RepID=A0A6M7WXT4_RHILI|nr:helix-turn-helix domain-containing protein [Mesorhizobium loti]QKD05409.1 helix-turn-helix domain-containing protein [Mesorhizobium loti R88b]
MDSPTPQMRRAPNLLNLHIHAGDAREFELWRSAYAPLYEMDAESPTARSAFSAGLTSYNLANVVIIDGRSSAETLERNARTLARSNIDHISLTVRSQGGFGLDIEGRATEVHTGDICVLDMTRRSTLRSTDYKSLTLVLPRTLLEPHVADLDTLHGRILPRDSALNTMLAAHMRLLYAQAPALMLPDIHAAAQATAAMVAAFAGPSSDGRDMIAQISAGASLKACRKMIDANLHDPWMGPEFLCNKLGVSRAKLYRMFEPLGGVTLYIQRRRLMRAYRFTIDPAYAQERISAIAIRCGFGNVSVFNRAFRQAHGMSPTELRAASLSREMHDTELVGDRAFKTMDRWLRGEGVAAA